eukprot:1194293-Prorocentrum_minimum.AAC.2
MPRPSAAARATAVSRAVSAAARRRSLSPHVCTPPRPLVVSPLPLLHGQRHSQRLLPFSTFGHRVLPFALFGERRGAASLPALITASLLSLRRLVFLLLFFALLVRAVALGFSPAGVGPSADEIVRDRGAGAAEYSRHLLVRDAAVAVGGGGAYGGEGGGEVGLPGGGGGGLEHLQPLRQRGPCATRQEAPSQPPSQPPSWEYSNPQSHMLGRADASEGTSGARREARDGMPGACSGGIRVEGRGTLVAVPAGARHLLDELQLRLRCAGKGPVLPHARLQRLRPPPRLRRLQYLRLHLLTQQRQHLPRGGLRARLA